jgi:hypothetical protein
MTSSRAQLTQVAKRLGPLRERAVFVGGATLELLVSDPGATTDDVDLVLMAPDAQPPETERCGQESVSAHLARQTYSRSRARTRRRRPSWLQPTARACG